MSSICSHAAARGSPVVVNTVAGRIDRLDIQGAFA
jgi:hypothetical protein